MPRKPRVLLIDDSKLILQRLELYLSSKFDVVTVAHPSDAIMEYGSFKFDLIITDLPNPESGYKWVSLLRQQHSGTPILAMNGWGKLPNGNELNADSVLLKPFDLEELNRCLDQLLVHRIS